MGNSRILETYVFVFHLKCLSSLNFMILLYIFAFKYAEQIMLF